MVLLRIILFPFAVLYGWITGLRNFLYDKGILKSASFDVPVIAVGNLSVGGTGKTPQVEYLIRLLSENHKVAVLSRGYKRKSSGFVLADPDSNAEILGDEPFQYHRKFPDIQVAVDADRKNGIARLLSLPVKPEVILLDDAYQHRRVTAGFYMLLTAYGDLYPDDFMLPTGHLREGRRGARRANIIVITKCPADISMDTMAAIRRKINPLAGQEVFFSSIDYSDYVLSENSRMMAEEAKALPKTLVAGIAKPGPFFAHLRNETDTLMTFPDHHDFTASDLAEIKRLSENKLIITTEKDYVRLTRKLGSARLYYLPIRTVILRDGDQFDKMINNYVGKSTANRQLH
ncbi:tetraacyldisaccharide 4'-kinase [Flavobacterium magnum]|uniref:Tetraacyldisaccharide 4'-kinase n=1 Tax=Flavobacterium magnum TaxID=2162713 RepID=A0A2S0RFK1_9FLAO|nr:tetraacyldisaccharide 4'-kinase [Flavobacterium magnum]AWA29861.1 tetraacyldisaccharide 4'-kinase [Flavobacterium magnum]